MERWNEGEKPEAEPGQLEKRGVAPHLLHEFPRSSLDPPKSDVFCHVGLSSETRIQKCRENSALIRQMSGEYR